MDRRQFIAAAAALLPLGADWDTTPKPSWDVSGEPLAACWDTSGEIIKPMPLALPVKRKLVTMFTATWCGKCGVEKAKIQAAGTLPFDVRLVDVSDGGQPGWVTSLPTFWWADNNGQSWHSPEFAAVLKDLRPVDPKPTQQKLQQPTQRAVGYHTHTCRNDGYRWGHVSGGHECAKCGRTEYRQDAATTWQPRKTIFSFLGIGK